MNAEHQFYAHALTPRAHMSPGDLLPLRVLLDGLAGLGALSQAAASPELALALPDHFQDAKSIPTNPDQCAPASVQLLLHQGPLDDNSPWWVTLAAGAVIVCTQHDGGKGPVIEGACCVSLNLGDGVCVVLLSGPVLDPLRDFVSELATSPDLAPRITALITACQSQIAWAGHMQDRLSMYETAPHAGSAKMGQVIRALSSAVSGILTGRKK